MDEAQELKAYIKERLPEWLDCAQYLDRSWTNEYDLLVGFGSNRRKNRAWIHCFRSARARHEGLHGDAPDVGYHMAAIFGGMLMKTQPFAAITRRWLSAR